MTAPTFTRDNTDDTITDGQLAQLNEAHGRVMAWLSSTGATVDPRINSDGVADVIGTIYTQTDAEGRPVPLRAYRALAMTTEEIVREAQSQMVAIVRAAVEFWGYTADGSYLDSQNRPINSSAMRADLERALEAMR